MTTKLQYGFNIRNSKTSDHPRILDALEKWWGGRDMTWMMPKLFLIHFNNTSFVVEEKTRLIAFLIGFLSPALSNECYVHFSGVHPDYRGSGIGKTLYSHFTQICKENNRDTVRACTSPVNKGSIEFHKKIGFTINKGNAVVEGVQSTLDYNKPNDPKVLFEMKI